MTDETKLAALEAAEASVEAMANALAVAGITGIETVIETYFSSAGGWGAGGGAVIGGGLGERRSILVGETLTGLRRLREEQARRRLRRSDARAAEAAGAHGAVHADTRKAAPMTALLTLNLLAVLLVLALQIRGELRRRGTLESQRARKRAKKLPEVRA